MNKLTTAAIIQRLMKNYIAPYKSKIILAIFFMVIAALCSAAIVQQVQPAIDDVFLTHNKQKLVLIPLIMLGIYCVKGIAEYFQNFLIKYVGQQILTSLQIEMYNHLLNADFLYLQSQSAGKLISRFTNDIILMRGAVSNMLVGCAKHFLSVVFLVILMFTLDPFLSALVFVAFPIAIYPIQKLGRKMRVFTADAQEELSNFTAKLDESFYGIKIIKSFCSEEIEVAKAQEITNKILDFYKNTAKIDSLTSPIMEMLSGLAIAGVLWYGGFAIINGHMTAGALFAFITAFVTAYRPFKSLVSLNVNLQEGVAAASRVFNILDQQPTITNLPGAKVISLAKPTIDFRNVHTIFTSNQEHITALDGIDLSLTYGKIYAFVGLSGSGKSTIANLLLRLFDPNVGEVIINGYNIKQLSLSSLRQQIAVVTQDTVLFDATISENIAYGQAVDMPRVIQAAQDADAAEFIEQLPQQYNAEIGSGGQTLSGGQRQRLAIARAFYKNAPIIIFDEATSALDTKAQANIMQALWQQRPDRLIMVVTHRLHSIKNVDEIIVLHQGQVIQRGSHQQLIKIDGQYQQLYNKELQDTDNDV